MIITQNICVSEKLRSKVFKKCFKKKTLTKNWHEMIMNSPTINVKPPASKEAVVDRGAIRSCAEHSSEVPAMPPSSLLCTGGWRDWVWSEQEHRGKPGQGERFRARAKPAKSKGRCLEASLLHPGNGDRGSAGVEALRCSLCFPQVLRAVWSISNCVAPHMPTRPRTTLVQPCVCARERGCICPVATTWQGPNNSVL